MSLFRATISDARSPIVGGLNALLANPGVFPIPEVRPFDNVSLFGPMDALSEIPLPLAPFDNISEFGPSEAAATVESAPFDNVSEYGGVSFSVEVDAAPFDDANGYGGVEIDIEVSVEAAPFDNVSEYGGLSFSVEVDAAPFDNVSEYGGVEAVISLEVDAAPYDGSVEHTFGQTEYCIPTFPDTSTDGWDYGIVVNASGTRTYVDVFGRTPDSGDLLVIICSAQEAATQDPTITGFTRLTDYDATGAGWTSAFYRLADGTEPANIVYSNWDIDTGWDFMHGLIVPAGEHHGTGDSDTIQGVGESWEILPDSALPISTGWGAGTKMTVIIAMTTAGSGNPVSPVPTGYTTKVNQTFFLGDTFRYSAIAEKQVSGDSDSPSDWSDGGKTLTLAVRGSATCVFGGNDVDAAPFDNVTEYGPVIAMSETPEIFVYSAPFDDTSVYGGVTIDIDEPVLVNAAPFDNTSAYGGIQIETYPVIFSSASTTSVEDSDSSHEVTMPLSSTGDFCVLAITHNGATPTIAGWTLWGSASPSGGVPGLAIFSRVLTGSEGTTITVSTDVGATCITHIVNILGSVADLSLAISSAALNPPSVSFTEPYSIALAFAACATAAQDITGYPAGYSVILNTNNTTGTNMDLASAQKGSISSSPEDPGTFSGGFPSNYVVATVIVHGP